MSSFSFIHWAMLALIVYILLIAVKGLIGAGGKEMHCLDCGTQGKSEIHTPGHRFIEIILWICFIIPGLSNASGFAVAKRMGLIAPLASSVLLYQVSPLGETVLRFLDAEA